MTCVYNNPNKILGAETAALLKELIYMNLLIAGGIDDVLLGSTLICGIRNIHCFYL